MNITCYVLSKRLRSTKLPAAGDTQATFAVVLKEPTDVLNPVFKITNTHWEAAAYNYIKATLGGKERYYHVTDVVHVSRELYEVRCSQDHLATWKTEIVASSQFVARSDDSSLYTHGTNNLLIDTAYPALAEVGFTRKVLSNVYDSQNGYFVLGIIGENIYTYLERGPVRYIVMTASQLGTLIHDFNQLTLSAADYNPLQYIVSCTYIPFTFDANDFTSHSSSWQLGSYTLAPRTYYGFVSGTTDGVEQMYLGTITLPDSTWRSSRGDCYNFSPWMTYHIYTGPFGDFDIPGDQLTGVSSRSISIEIAIDHCSGEGHLEIYQGNRPIIVLNTQLGVQVMLTQITSNSLMSQYEVGAHLASSLSSAMSFHLGNSAAEMGAAVMSSYAAGIPKLSSLGSNGSMASIYNDDIILVATERAPSAEDIHHIGRPVCEVFTLSSVSTGKYIKTINATIALPAFDAEIDAIERLLDTGIYLD